MTTLKGKNILITGAARRIGHHLAMAVARQGANVVIHHGHSITEAENTRLELLEIGVEAHVIDADLNDSLEVQKIIPEANQFGSLYAIINNASLFTHLSFQNTQLKDWQEAININLTAPFILSQAFADTLPPGKTGRIINILDWRALRPGVDHFPYTISKAGLAAMTRSLALSLAPRIQVNGLALGAILPPADDTSTANIIKNVPAGRWASLDEVGDAVLFLLTGPEYITGEIIHVDGGRHLV